MADKRASEGSASNGEMEAVKTGTIAPMPAFRQLLQVMEMQATMDANSETGNTSMLATVEAILTADTEEEMWEADERGPIGGRNLTDVEQEITGFSVKFSRSTEMRTAFITTEGKRMYLMVDAVRLDTAETIQWDTSAPLLVAKLFWLDRHAKFPYRCVIRPTDLGGGQAVLKLKPVATQII